MKINKYFLLFIFIIANYLVSGQCLVSSLTINTGYDPLSGSAITPGVTAGTPVIDPHWIVTAISPSVAPAITAMATPGLVEVVVGSYANVVANYGGWVSNPVTNPGNWISCLNGPEYFTDGTGPTGTAYNMKLSRSFRLCSDDSIRLNFFIANDNYISSTDIDGTPLAFSQPASSAVSYYTTFTNFTQTLFLTAGTHTINILSNDYNISTPTINPTGIDIYGTVSSVTGSTSLVSESDTSCISYVCAAAVAVCNTLSLPDSIHACKGDVVTLPATVSGPDSVYYIGWSQVTGLSDTSILSPMLTTTAPGWYALTVRSISPVNLVVNGDFSAGDVGFTSAYTYVSGPGSLVPAGVYAVTPDPHDDHPTAASFYDHTTGTVTGSMMAINGASTPIDVWCEHVTVTPNTYYNFSAWFANWSSDTSTNLPIIQFEINGTLIGSLFSFPHPDGIWTQFFTTWYSGTNTSITICINDQQTAASGNDFAIDDISFQQLCVTEDSVYIAVKIPDTLHSRMDTSLCAGSGPVTLTTPAGYTSYLWNTGSVSTSIAVSSGGMYSVFALGNCSAEYDTMQVTFDPLPVVTLGNDTTICVGNKITFGSPEPAGDSYLWSTGSTDSSVSVSNSGAYSLIVTENGCSASASIQLNVIANPGAINLGPDTALCKGEEIRLYANGDTVLWSDGSRGQSLLVIESGTYWASVATQCGIATDSINVDFGLCDIWFPSAFTPNDDGRNDIIRVVGNLKYYTNFSLSIYDRFGQRVFYTEDINSGWNGVYNGVKQDLGSYFYMIYYTLQGNKHMMKGDFQLIR